MGARFCLRSYASSFVSLPTIWVTEPIFKARASSMS